MFFYPGASFPWAEEHEMISVCPDSYNQTSFRLVIEKGNNVRGQSFVVSSKN